MSAPTINAIIAELDYEVRMRREVYARRVAARKMRQAEADYKIALMEEGRNVLAWLQSIDRDELKAYLAHRMAGVHNQPNQGSEKKFTSDVNGPTPDTTA